MENIEKALNAEYCPLLALSELRAEIKKLEAIEKELSKMAVREMASSKEIVKNGLSFTYTTKKSYKFDHDEQHEEIKKMLKVREEQMKASYTEYERGSELVIDGEIVPPCIVTFSDVITIRPKK